MNIVKPRRCVDSAGCAYYIVLMGKRKHRQHAKQRQQQQHCLPHILNEEFRRTYTFFSVNFFFCIWGLRCLQNRSFFLNENSKNSINRSNMRKHQKKEKIEEIPTFEKRQYSFKTLETPPSGRCKWWQYSLEIGVRYINTDHQIMHAFVYHFLNASSTVIFLFRSHCTKKQKHNNANINSRNSKSHSHPPSNIKSDKLHTRGG